MNNKICFKRWLWWQCRMNWTTISSRWRKSSHPPLLAALLIPIPSHQLLLHIPIQTQAFFLFFKHRKPSLMLCTCLLCLEVSFPRFWHHWLQTFIQFSAQISSLRALLLTCYSKEVASLLYSAPSSPLQTSAHAKITTFVRLLSFLLRYVSSMNVGVILHQYFISYV